MGVFREPQTSVLGLQSFIGKATVPYPGHKVSVIDEVIKEFVPGFGDDTSSSDHVRQFYGPILGQGGEGLVRTDVNAHNVAIGEVVVVGDDGFDQLDIFVQHFGDVVDGADISIRYLEFSFEHAV
jgi:hypothetical protein